MNSGSEYIMKKDYGSHGFMFVRQEGDVYTLINLSTYEEIYVDENFINNLQPKMKNNWKTKLRYTLRQWLEEEMIEEEDMRLAFNLIERI
jgi:translation elongation factor P/translation initiation factor 5A